MAVMLFASLSLFAQNADPVLMKVNGVDVTRSEFEYTFNKNNAVQGADVKAVKEYLPMYVDFKLKVAEAKAQGIDTLSSFIEEYKADRARQAEEYLIDNDYIERKAHEMYAKDSAAIGKDGFLKLTQVFFPVRQKASAETVVAIKAKADSAYQMLNNGADFADVVRKYMSVAPDTFEVIRGQVFKEVEDAVYALRDGGFTHPVKSPAGFHIIKRVSHRPFGSYQDYRSNIMTILEQRDIKRVARYKLGYDLAKKMAPGTTPEQALAHEDSLLETKYPEFGNLMREYREGLLFFEISNREVWQKAAADEAGLEKFFKKNKKKYKFDAPHYRGAVIYCNSDDELEKARKLLADAPLSEYRQIVGANFTKDSVCTIKLESGVFRIGDNAWVDKLAFGQGKGGKMKKGYAKVGAVGKILKKKPESYKDVHGRVVSDYQQHLEKEWVKTLRDKYKVEVYDDVLKTVNKH